MELDKATEEKSREAYDLYRTESNGAGAVANARSENLLKNNERPATAGLDASDESMRGTPIRMPTQARPPPRSRNTPGRRSM